MIIGEFKYFPYVRKLKNSFQNSFNKISQREVIIISLTDELGNTAFGECSPLPGFSYESIDEATDQINKLFSLMNGLNVESSISHFENIINKRMLFPSVKFGLEQCFLNLLVLRDNSYIKNTFGEPQNEIHINAVYGISERLDIISQIEKKINAGYETFKLKIGRELFSDDLKLVESVRKYFGYKIKLRLDANGKWNSKEAISNIKELSEFNIEYIEEPCTDLDTNIGLVRKSSIPIAVDESLQTLKQAFDVIGSSNIRFIILKPTILGGIFNSFKLIAGAEKKEKITIISSSFESGIGLSALALLASLTKHNYAHGLDTINFFEQDIADPSFEIKNGKINFSSGYTPPKIQPV